MNHWTRFVLAYYFRPGDNGIADVVWLYEATEYDIEKTKGVLGARQSFSYSVGETMEALIRLGQVGLVLAEYLIGFGFSDLGFLLLWSVVSKEIVMFGLTGFFRGVRI